MSTFNCEHCGAACTEGEGGYYVTGCEHYPDDRAVKQSFTTQFDGPYPPVKPNWLSRDCKHYPGRCRCDGDEARCIPA